MCCTMRCASRAGLRRSSRANAGSGCVALPPAPSPAPSRVANPRRPLPRLATPPQRPTCLWNDASCSRSSLGRWRSLFPLNCCRRPRAGSILLPALVVPFAGDERSCSFPVQVTVALELPPTCTNAAYTLRKNYYRWLYAFECHDVHNITLSNEEVLPPAFGGYAARTMYETHRLL